MDIFMATFGPVGPDGYPKLLYDKWTGVIDRSVAEYWREHYDLRHILQRDWKTIGPMLVGKIHVFMGDQDTFLLEEATYKLQEFLESTKDPHYAGSFGHAGVPGPAPRTALSAEDGRTDADDGAGRGRPQLAVLTTARGPAGPGFKGGPTWSARQRAISTPTC
jgi:hypothetical protein